MLKLIWAEDLNGIIGNKNKLPWSISTDLKYFKNKTSEHVIVMGSKTFESLNFKPLPNRLNIVLTNNKDYINNEKFKENKELIFTNDIDKILNLSKFEDVYIIGGASIYKQFLPHADEILRTKIQKSYKGDTFMEPLPKHFRKVNITKVQNDKEPELWFEVFKPLDII